MKINWTKKSIDCLQQIKDYISLDNEANAVKFIEKIFAIAESLNKNPERGRVVPEFSKPNIREIIYKNYRIVYLYEKNSISILTIFEGHKRLK